VDRLALKLISLRKRPRSKSAGYSSASSVNALRTTRSTKRVDLSFEIAGHNRSYISKGIGFPSVRFLLHEGQFDLKQGAVAIDQRASNLLFGERRRLQEDLLADAATAELRKLFPKMHHCPSGAPRRRR
jgi:hypothetical protein